MISKLEKNRIIPANVTFLILIVIFFVSSIPGDSKSLKLISNFPSIFFYIYHFSVFFLFTFFLIPAVKGEKKLNKKFIFIILIVSLSYAFLSEFYQIFIVLRNSSVLDVLIDFAGSSFAILIYTHLGSKKRNSN